MAVSANDRHPGWSETHSTASQAGWLAAFVLMSLIPGAIAVGLGRSPFAIFWVVVFTALAIGVVAAVLPSSWSR